MTPERLNELKEPLDVSQFGLPATECRELISEVERLQKVEAENIQLRAILANSDRPCIYCSLPANDMSKCVHGFPGCGRGDDMLSE